MVLGRVCCIPQVEPLKVLNDVQAFGVGVCSAAFSSQLHGGSNERMVRVGFPGGSQRRCPREAAVGMQEAAGVF